MQLDRHAAFQVQEVRVSVTPLHRKDKIESGSQDCAVPLSETTNRKDLDRSSGPVPVRKF